MSLAVTLAQPEVAKVVEPALSTLAQTMLGAVCFLCIVVAGVAVWKLLSVQEKAADRAESHNQRLEVITNKMTDTINKFDKTIDKLVEAEKQSQEIQKDQSQLLSQLKNSFETTIRDALLASRYRRSFTPGSGTPSGSPDR